MLDKLSMIDVGDGPFLTWSTGTIKVLGIMLESS